MFMLSEARLKIFLKNNHKLYTRASKCGSLEWILVATKFFQVACHFSMIFINFYKIPWYFKVFLGRVGTLHRIEVDRSYSPLRATTLRLIVPTHLWVPLHWGWQVPTHLWEPPHWGWLVLLTSEHHHIEVDMSYSPLSTTTLRLIGPTHLWVPPHWGWQVIFTSESHHIEVIGPTHLWVPPHWGWQVIFTSESHHIEVIGPTHLRVPPHWDWQVPTHLYEPPHWGWLVLLTSERHHIEVDMSYSPLRATTLRLTGPISPRHCAATVATSGSAALFNRINSDTNCTRTLSSSTIKQWNMQCHGNRSQIKWRHHFNRVATF